MKLAQHDDTTLAMGNILSSTDFTAVIDGKMFTILSNSLYANKIGSCVREYSFNALDSHIAAGTPELPFTIHAPNSLEPWFSVKDTGVGLTHEEIVTIYTCFNNSTKNTSNEQVGSFGFGSKVGFSLTDTFTVVSIKDGIQNTYAATKKEDGTPTMVLMDTCATTEHNGLEVKIPVEHSDIRTFAAEIVNQLAYLKVKPIITGNSSIQFPDVFANVIETVDNVYFRNAHTWNVKPIIVQGGANYPLDMAEVDKAIANDTVMLKFCNEVIQYNSPIIIFNIGEIEVTPSREAVSYSKTTVGNIVAALRNAKAKLESKVHDTLDALPTHWERALYLRNNKSLYAKVIDYSNNKWGVKCVGDDPYIMVPESFRSVIVNDLAKIDNNVECYYGSKGRRGGFNINSKRETQVVPTNNAVFVVDDGSKSGRARLVEYITRHNKIVYLLTARTASLASVTETTKTLDDGTVVTTKTPIYGDFEKIVIDDTYVNEVKTLFAGATFMNLADLPKPEREVRESNGQVKERAKYTIAKMYKFNGYGNRRYGDMVFTDFEKVYTKASENEGRACYVMIEGRNLFTTDVNENVLRELYRSGAWSMPIYALREKDIAKIADDENWIRLAVEVENVKKAYVELYKKQIVRNTVKASVQSGLSDFICDDFTRFLMENIGLIFDPLLAKWAKRMAKNNTAIAIPEFIRNEFHREIGTVQNKMTEKNKKFQNELSSRYDFIACQSFTYNFSFTGEQAAKMLDCLNAYYEKHVANS